MIRIDDADMREHTSFRAGGHAKILLIPDSEAELIETITDLNRSGQRYIIMGNGTNILVKDGGYDGTIVKMADAFSQIDVEDTLIHAGSGALLSSVAASALTNDLTGLEFASGIPGSIGGGTYMNAGAYGGEMKNVLERIYLVSRKGERYSLAAEEMCYGYRHSVLYDTHDIVLSVDIRLEKGDHAKIASTMKELSVKRTTKQPLSYPSAGSFFKRPPGHFAGKLIQDAGLMGLAHNGAKVSDLHAGFIINTGDATAGDIVALMHIIQATVKDKFGVDLEPEVRIIGNDKEEY